MVLGIVLSQLPPHRPHSSNVRIILDVIKVQVFNQQVIELADTQAGFGG